MAFADWDTFAVAIGADPTALLNIATPINGSGSLQHQLNVGNDNNAITTTLNSGFNRGLTKGRIRTLMRYDWEVEAAGTRDNFNPGIFYMASNLDIANNASNFYVATVARLRASPGEIVPVIGRAGSKLLAAMAMQPTVGADAIADTASGITGVVEGDVLPIQIEWNLDIAGLGGMRHTMSVGQIGDLDFTGLSVVYDFIEVSPILTSLVEGIAWQNTGSGSVVGDSMIYDDTGVFQLV